MLVLVKSFKAQCTLVVGNGEERIIQQLFNNDFNAFVNFCKDSGFHDVYRDLILKFADRKFYINHFPRKHRDGYVNLFGHTHRVTGLWKPYGLNVGCDLNHFRLFSEDDIVKLLNLKERWWDTDEDNLSM